MADPMRQIAHTKLNHPSKGFVPNFLDKGAAGTTVIIFTNEMTALHLYDDKNPKSLKFYLLKDKMTFTPDNC